MSAAPQPEPTEYEWLDKLMYQLARQIQQNQPLELDQLESAITAKITELLAAKDAECELKCREARRETMVELRGQWAVWLDDHAKDRHSIKQIVKWLDSEIAWFDREYPNKESA